MGYLWKRKLFFAHGRINVNGALTNAGQDGRAVQAGTPMTVKRKTPRGLARSDCGVFIFWLFFCIVIDVPAKPASIMR